MSKFQPVTLTWQGKKYTIPADRMMGAIGRIEDFVTLIEIERYTRNQQTMPLAKLASAFAAVITYAGAVDVKAEDVYAEMFQSATNAEETTMKSVLVLLGMMVPPKSVAGPGAPGKSQPAAAKSSRKRTRRPS